LHDIGTEPAAQANHPATGAPQVDLRFEPVEGQQIEATRQRLALATPAVIG
jgi:hypothetical protein